MSGSMELVASLKKARISFLRSIEGLEQPAMKLRPAVGEWSIIEILAHMPAVDDCYLSQALEVTRSPGIRFDYFDDEAWKVAHPSPDSFELSHVFGSLQEAHNRVIAGATSLRAEALLLPCLHPRGIPYTVRDILARLPAHDANHQLQIEEVRSQSHL